MCISTAFNPLRAKKSPVRILRSEVHLKAFAIENMKHKLWKAELSTKSNEYGEENNHVAYAYHKTP